VQTGEYGEAAALGGLAIAHGKISPVQIGMLGSFEVRTDDGVLADVPGARLRGLLIALALEPGHAVPKATLVDWIWVSARPPTRRMPCNAWFPGLRKALPDGLVEGQADGYRLMVEPDAVDAVRFERLVAQARNDEDPRAGTAAARGPRIVAWCGHAGRRLAG